MGDRMADWGTSVAAERGKEGGACGRQGTSRSSGSRPLPNDHLPRLHEAGAPVVASEASEGAQAEQRQLSEPTQWVSSHRPAKRVEASAAQDEKAPQLSETGRRAGAGVNVYKMTPIIRCFRMHLLGENLPWWQPVCLLDWLCAVASNLLLAACRSKTAPIFGV